jgi:glycosyltransferase involved in cell wall biosynthesis
MPGMKILRMSEFPPPFGGVTIHVQRLHEYLLSRGADCRLVNLMDEVRFGPPNVRFSRKEALRLLFTGPRSIVHFHAFHFENLSSRIIVSFFLLYLVSLRHITVHSFHNERFLEKIDAYYPKTFLGRLKTRFMLFCFNRFTRIVVDNTVCQDLAGRIVRDKRRIAVIPEFIPPVSVPPLDHEGVLAMRRAHKVILGSNAYRISFHKGQDLYGIDMLVELVHRLHTDHGVDAAMVFLLPNIGEPDYFGKINARIAELGIGDRFLFVTEPLEEACSLWKLTDVFIRATNTDGNSMSLMEAMALGVPSIASDCTVRPAGPVLFKTRDTDDLLEKTVEVVAQLDLHRQKLKEAGWEDNGAAMLKMYEELWRRA